MVPVIWYGVVNLRTDTILEDIVVRSSPILYPIIIFLCLTVNPLSHAIRRSLVTVTRV